tara:strand:+ start:91 stop:426 length:336 start_codon:yes stop_codon:yes gene_type:complete
MSTLELTNIESKDTEKEYIAHIDVNGYKIRKIRNIFCCLSPHYSDFNWKKIYIFYGRVGFLVYYTDQHPSFKFVIRPAKKYLKIEFEQLFGFNFKCRGYREDKMRALVKPE